MMLKPKQNENGNRYSETNCGSEFSQMISSGSDIIPKNHSSDFSAVITQMDGIIHQRMKAHFRYSHFSNLCGDYMQQKLDICESLGKLIIWETHKGYSQEISIGDFGSSLFRDYLKPDDNLYTHVLGLREEYLKYSLLGYHYSPENSDPLKFDYSYQKNGAGYGSYDGVPQFENLTKNRSSLGHELNWAQHFDMNLVCDLTSLTVSNSFQWPHPSGLFRVGINPVCNGPLFYTSRGSVETFNQVCHGSVFYPSNVKSSPVFIGSMVYLNRASGLKNSLHDVSVTYHKRKSSVENQACNDLIVYANRTMSVQTPVSNDLTVYANRTLSVQNPVCNDLMVYANRTLSVQNPLCNDLMVYANRTLSVQNPVHKDLMLYSHCALKEEKSPYNSFFYYNRDLSLKRMLCSGLMFREAMRAHPNGRGVTDTIDLIDFDCEDSFILHGHSLKCAAEEGQLSRFKDTRSRKKKSYTKNIWENIRAKSTTQNIQSLLLHNSMVSQTMHGSLFEFQGCVYFIAKDQIGCQFLRNVFEEGNYQDIQLIFNETIDHMAELMMDPFANYLIRKLLEVCTEEQKTQIVFMVTARQKRFLDICLNRYGTCVVQKLIETLKTRKQKRLVVSALQMSFLELVNDANGYNVIKCCLQFLSKEDTKFIIDAAAKCHVGCCILKSCIAQSAGSFREKLVTEIASEGFNLAQDAFGNYVIQHIIELNIPSAVSILSCQFRGNYVYLSMQKFSSYVVQTFLKNYEKSRPLIIQEFLSVPHFEQLLQDPFANYVIQTAVNVSKGPLRDLLVEEVRIHTTRLSSPYCKRFSRILKN